MNESIEKTIQALRRHNMGVQFAETKEAVIPALREILREGDSVGVGGSVTLDECGVIDFLRSGDYSFIDRYAPDADVDEALHDSLFADAYITGCNAVTEQGELVNMDGRANRVAALAYGPHRVIVIAGVNKIVPDEAAARQRIFDIAAPKNAQRLHCKTPCAVTGKCAQCRDTNPDTICCSLLVQGMQRVPGRIQVILVGEALGY